LSVVAVMAVIVALVVLVVVVGVMALVTVNECVVLPSSSNVVVVVQ